MPLGFDRFWSAYPNRTHRIDAEKAWRAIDPPPDTVDRIVAAIEVWRTSRQWSQKQFIPHPATWLRNRLWEDEFVATAGAQQATQSATALDSLRRQYEFLRRRAETGGEQARLTLAEFVRDQGAKLGLDQGTTGEPPAPPLEEVAP
jgi:hypothetical protein